MVHLFPVFLFLSIGALALFSFLAVASWSGTRLAERKEYYKSETLKKVAENQGPGAAAALEYLREEERTAARRRREGQKLGGMIMAAVGIGLMVFLATVSDKQDKGAFLVGLIPLLIGVALFVHTTLLAPKD